MSKLQDTRDEASPLLGGLPSAPIRTQPPAYAPRPPVGPVGPIAVQVVAPALSPMELGRNPFKANCPACGRVVTTSVHYVYGTSPWVDCIPLCFIGSCCCCCLLPFFTNQTKNSEHSCPNCHHFFGTFNPKLVRSL